MREALLGAWVAVATFVPKLLLFLVILIIGLIVAKVLSRAVDKVLDKVGFDRAVERGGIKQALAKSKYDASAIVGKIVYYFLLLFVLQLAFGIFGPNPISELLTAIIAFLPRLFVAIIIIVISAAIAAAARELIRNTLGGLSYGSTLATIVGVFILGLGVIAALNQIGVATTVTTPILITVLAIVAGVVIVGAGGGLIKPMQQRWEDWLNKAEAEAPKIKEHADAAPSLREQAGQLREQAQQAYEQTGQPTQQPSQQPSQAGSQAYTQPDQAYPQPGQAYLQPGQAYPQPGQAYPQPGQANPAADPNYNPNYDPTRRPDGSSY